MFYALSDRFTGDLPREYTSGFANTKEVICFTSKKLRDAWVSETKLMTAKPLTLRQAVYYTEIDENSMVEPRMHKIWESRGFRSDVRQVRVVT